MSVLMLVRHGQASFSAADYDQLSPAGAAQAERLGDYWSRQAGDIDEVYIGPRRRQQQTAELAGARYRSAGRSWPDPIVLEELDEYDLGGLLGRLAPALARQDRAFAELSAAHRGSTGPDERARSFQRMFETLLLHWQAASAPAPAPADGDASADSVESWHTFRTRVRHGLERITDRPGRGRRVAAFTSGGFIGTAVGLALGVSDRTCLELNWRLRNGSLTNLLFSPGRLTLDDFNTLPHLSDPADWTYR
jgi:broad specificity phosphatase PhoE